MSIWKHPPTLEGIRALGPRTMVESLGIEFVEIGDDFVRATMPVDHRHVQPMRLLHGGASAVLAESLGSVAANLCVDNTREFCVGLEINANHVAGMREGGTVVATARPVHIGRTTQVWDIRIEDLADGRLVCVSRLTLAVRQVR